MSVSIKYKGAEIASASTEVTKTIKTAGKYCEADILVENTPDGGGTPVINPLTVTANGTYTAPSGVDGYSPINVNVPQGITPTGNINITDTNVTDVTNYATATIVDADLVASNIKKNVNILGVVGSFEGGGSLPSSISKIDGGSFTPAANTKCNNYSIQHNLGEMPKGAIIWCPELMESETAPINYGFAYAFLSFLQIATSAGGYTYGFNHFYRRATTTGAALRELTFSSETSRSNSATTTTFKHNMDDNYYFAGMTYKWLAWA